MDYLISNLGENRVTLPICGNEYQQSVDYEYTNNSNLFYDDLFKKRKTLSSSKLNGSNSSISSIGAHNFEKGFISSKYDSFAYILLYLSDSTISVLTSDSLKKRIIEFKKQIKDSDIINNIKKITKAQKQLLEKQFTEEIFSVYDVTLQVAAKYLDTNIVLIENNKVREGIVNIEKPTALIVFDKEKNIYKLKLLYNEPTHEYEIVRDHIIKNAMFDKNMVSNMNLKDLKKAAIVVGISLTRTENGQEIKLLKNDIKLNILTYLDTHYV
jgi:hypothetical protein